MRGKLTIGAAQGGQASSSGLAPNANNLVGASNCLAPLIGNKSNFLPFHEMWIAAAGPSEFYRGGLSAGAAAGRDFLARVGIGNVAAAAIFSNALRKAMNLAFARMKTEGADENDLAAWTSGFVLALIPYAIAWNFAETEYG
jgi:hypothetical protein